MVLGHPEAMVAETIYVTGELDGILKGLRRCASRRDR
jgi:hypothetical protein